MTEKDKEQLEEFLTGPLPIPVVPPGEEPTVKALRLISVNLGLMALAYAIFYFGPSSFVRAPRPEGYMEKQISIVQNIEQFGPVWPFVFAFTGVLIVGSTILGRGVIASHGLAAGLWFTYGAAILFSSLASQPPSPILSGAAALFGAVTHIGMARAWAGEGVR